MKEEKKFFCIFLGSLLFMFLLLSFMSYKYYDCKCYENQPTKEWIYSFSCHSYLDKSYHGSPYGSCIEWVDFGGDFFIFLLLFILSMGLLGLILYIMFKFFRTGLPRPNLSEEQKEKTVKWMELEKTYNKIDWIFFVAGTIYLIYFAFRIMFYGNISFPLILILIAIIMVFIGYKNYR